MHNAYPFEQSQKHDQKVMLSTLLQYCDIGSKSHQLKTGLFHSPIQKLLGNFCFCQKWSCHTRKQGKKTQSTVLNPRRAKFYNFQVLTVGALHTVYHESSAIFKKYTRYFFNATHQVKAIAIGVSEANPLVEIGWLLWCVHVHVFFPWFS